MSRTISFTKRQAGFIAITASLAIATVSIGGACAFAFAFCSFVVLTS